MPAERKTKWENISDKPFVDVRDFGAKGNNVHDDTIFLQFAIDSSPEGSLIYVPQPPVAYKITKPLVLRNRRLMGGGMKGTKILQHTPAADVLIAGGRISISDLILGHHETPVGVSVPNGTGIKVDRIMDGSTIERIELLHNTCGIYCNEPVTETINYIFSTTIKDIRFYNFNHAAMDLRGYNGGITGCVLSNLYATNSESTYGGATYGFYFSSCSEMTANQLNVEQGRYNMGIVVISCDNFLMNSIHFEGYTPAQTEKAFFVVDGIHTKVVQINGVTIQTCIFDGDLASNYGILNIGQSPEVFMNGLVTRDNIRTNGATVRRFIGESSVSKGAAIRARGFKIIDSIVNYGDLNIDKSALPVLREYNDSRYYWEINEKKNLTGTAAPVRGNWGVGDTVWNTNPVAGGYLGWVCTAAGTPGTWKAFGLIAT
ncbi:MAG: hypothetical protein JL50_20885 [Peptococcaceae bacterium BICA1-7]|nr:MAG: hypothetical protein JL50_20885 [Peptococcaceae bacterium BICA1-7]HBV98539.1 hypothetical protein [Desulfotomaculum sp.]